LEFSLQDLMELYRCELCRGVSCLKPICSDCERTVAGIIGWAERVIDQWEKKEGW